MKDYSLSDVAFCNTKEGMHRKAMELNIAPWNLGCSCEECNRAFEAVLAEDKKNADSVGRQDNVYARQIRSEVLEEVAANLKLWYPDHAAINAYCAAVRSMKK